MSSLRNALQRRTHKERGQPQEREKYGLLEKHKDYSARAKDYNFKKAKLKALHRKAIDKNPDEFYWLLKTQDLGYIRTMRNMTIKEVKEAERVVKGIKWEGKAIVFVDTQEAQADKLEYCFGISEEDRGYRFDDLDGMDDKPLNSEPMGVNVIDKEVKLQRNVQEKRATQRLGRLEAAKARLKVLTDAEHALDLQRAKMAKSVTVGGITKDGRRFKIRERKR